MAKNWKDYEIYITRHFQKLFPDASVRHNITRVGLISNVKRQIDILIEQKIAGFNLNIIVDCKYFNKKVDVKEVESFLSFLQDLKASKGILITNKGYSQAAENRANYDTQDIELRIIDFGDLEFFQNFFAIPYQDSSCAIVSAPPGWIIDSRTENSFLASLYPAGLSRREGFHLEGFIYINFFNKDSNAPKLANLLEIQEIKLNKQYSNVQIEYLPTIGREDCNCKLRIVNSAKMQDCKTLEYTLFLDFIDVVIFLVLLTPINKEREYVKKLEWVGQKLIKGKMLYDNMGQPLEPQLKILN
ncbi:restriction endonuclease [Altericista sp. CCNU0014]|uniref:restriction endonuclease n=1 Tax=Altericista sp. CCNU0014 TaxID=3082949 RepID=UPI0038506BCE